MKRVTVLAALAVLMLGSVSGCTIRYSQALAGSIPAVEGKTVSSNSRGLSILQIAVVEPAPAHEQARSLIQGCRELARVQVDYRDLVFILFSIPRVEVTATCVQ